MNRLIKASLVNILPKQISLSKYIHTYGVAQMEFL